MEYLREVIESSGSIEHINHTYICKEDERENILILIKAKFPNMDIQLLRNGYSVKEIRKKSEKEKEEYFKSLPPRKVKTANDDYMFEDKVNKLKKKK